MSLCNERKTGQELEVMGCNHQRHQVVLPKPSGTFSGFKVLELPKSRWFVKLPDGESVIPQDKLVRRLK